MLTHQGLEPVLKVVLVGEVQAGVETEDTNAWNLLRHGETLQVAVLAGLRESAQDGVDRSPRLPQQEDHAE